MTACRFTFLISLLTAAAALSLRAEPAPGAGPAPVGTGTSVQTAAGTLSLQEAVLRVLKQNRALQFEQTTPDITRTYEQTARAEFDPVLTSSVTSSVTRNEVTGAPFDLPANRVDSSTTGGGVQLGQKLPTGTRVSLEAAGAESKINDGRVGSTGVGISVTQSLLKGLGTDVNLARLREARVDTAISEYELRGFIEALVQGTEDAYWTLALAERGVTITQESLHLAEEQLDQTRKRIEAGTVAPSEIPGAEAEVASRRQDVVNAQSFLETSRLQMQQLMSPENAAAWTAPLRPGDDPAILPAFDADPVETHVAVAWRMRPEMNQSRLQITRGDLEVVRTRNGLLPSLDAFVYYGPTAYSRTFKESLTSADDKHYSAGGGLTLTWPIGSRAEKAEYQRSRLRRDQAGEALANLSQLVELDVRTALVAVQRTRAQIDMTEATHRLRTEALRVETEKFNNGKSTTLLVNQAQRDLLRSQVDEIAAKIDHRKAVVNFYRLEGSLLVRRGIDAPGRNPIEPDLGPRPAGKRDSTPTPAPAAGTRNPGT